VRAGGGTGVAAEGGGKERERQAAVRTDAG